MPDSNPPPLDERKIVVDHPDGKRSLPALHKDWAPRSAFANYMSLVSSRGKIIEGDELDEWLYEARGFRDDLVFLLSRKHHEFWSYMLHQSRAHAAIVSFLQRATPFYIDIRQQTSQAVVIELYEDIVGLVLRIMYRLVTTRESTEEWATNSHMRELLYKNYLMTVPMLIDLLVAVGDTDSSNAALLREIFASLLAIEPNYRSDLHAAISFFKAAYRSIQVQAENEGFDGAGGGGSDDGAQTPYDEVAFYTLDCAYTLSLLLDICLEAPVICDEIKLGPSIAHFYDTTIPFLYKNIFLINETASSLDWLNQARLQLLKAFRCLTYSYISNCLEKTGDNLAYSEQFVALLTECLSEQTFVIDYQRAYPIELDMEILQAACKDLDTFKSSFVLKGYQKEAETSVLHTIESLVLSEQGAHDIGSTEKSKNRSPSKKLPATAASPAVEVARDISAEVNAVLDVLPNLGTGFVRRVLSRYDRSEDAIAAILESNLPPDLQNIDESEEYIPPDLQDKLYEETGVKHFNKYDGDAYDVLTHSKPDCIIKRGKGFPNAPQNAAQLLDDKSGLQAIRHRYEEFALVTEDGDDDEYEDEYDDSYEALLESETRVLKSKELKAGLANIVDVSDGESSSEEEAERNEGTATANNRHTNFCEDPAEVRARYEARRQAKWGDRSADKKPPSVVGAPKGQGQTQDTVRNRQKKEAHKSSRANHNRKAGAAFKRSKGMLS